MQKKEIILESKIEVLKKKDKKTEKRIRQTIKKHKIEQEELVKKSREKNTLKPTTTKKSGIVKKKEIVRRKEIEKTSL